MVSVTDQTDNFADAFVRKEGTAKGYAVVTTLLRYYVRNLTPGTILLIKIQRKKMDILMFKHRFQCEFGCNDVKYARITTTHVCYIALYLPAPSRDI